MLGWLYNYVLRESGFNVGPPAKFAPQQILPIHPRRRSEDRGGWDWRLDFEADRLRTRSDRVL